jgi:hypothetical protein
MGDHLASRSMHAADHGDRVTALRILQTTVGYLTLAAKVERDKRPAKPEPVYPVPSPLVERPKYQGPGSKFHRRLMRAA